MSNTGNPVENRAELWMSTTASMADCLISDTVFLACKCYNGKGAGGLKIGHRTVEKIQSTRAIPEAGITEAESVV